MFSNIKKNFVRGDKKKYWQFFIIILKKKPGQNSYSKPITFKAHKFSVIYNKLLTYLDGRVPLCGRDHI